MARLDAAANGAILRALFTDAEEAATPDAHPGTVAQLRFDHDAAGNAALIVDLQQSTDAYRYDGATLTKQGQPVAVSADSAETTFRKQAAQLLQGQRDYLALQSPTAAQTVQVCQAQAKLLLLLAKLAQRNGWL